MPHRPTRRTVIVSMASLAVLPALPAFAANNFEVAMLNKDPDDKKKRNIFKPLIQVVEPGDTVKFVAESKGHNSASIKGMLPEGVEEWNGKIGKDIEVTFETPGVYGYKCTPHLALGMAGLIIVKGEGVEANYEAAKEVKQRGKAKKVFKAIWEQVEAENLLS